MNITEGLEGSKFVIVAERVSCKVTMNLDSEEAEAFKIEKLPEGRKDEQLLEPDKLTLAVSLDLAGNEVIVWNLETGQEVCHFYGEAEFTCCSCTKDGALFLAGDSAGGVHAFRLHLSHRA